VRYRRPFGTDWEDLDLDTAMDMIADRVIAARRDGWQWEVDGAPDPPDARAQRPRRPTSASTTTRATTAARAAGGAAEGAGQHRAAIVCAQETAALQGKQQRERWPDDQHGDDEQDDDCDEGGMRSAGVAQRHCGAGQQHRVLSHAPAPDHGGDPERGDDPDATQPAGGEQGPGRPGHTARRGSPAAAPAR